MTRRAGRPKATHGSKCERCGQVHTRCIGHRNSDGGPCMKWPVRGGPGVCGTHGARAPQVQAKTEQRKALVKVEREAARLGGSIDANPIDVLLEQVREAAANVEVLREWISEHLQVGVGGESSIVEAQRVIEGEYGATVVPATAHIMVTLYNQERDRLVKYARLCLDAGVEERRVQLAELQGRRLSEVVKAAVEALNPSDEGRATAFKAAGDAMRRIGAGG